MKTPALRSSTATRPNEQIGGAWQQTVDIGDTARQVVWDYIFTMTNGTTTWEVAVIDIDLNNDNDLDDGGEDGYYLIFPDGMHPADTDLTAGAITNNANFTPHADLGAAIVCFASGMMIDTTVGPRVVETLQPGDLVLTQDEGTQPVRWLRRTSVAAFGDLVPIGIAAGTLDSTSDLVASPQYAILLSDWRAEFLFGQQEIPGRAVDLLGRDDVYRRSGGRVTYHHMLLDAHHMLRRYGQWTESLYPGDVTLMAIDNTSRTEIQSIFPDLKKYGPEAAPYIRSFEATCLRFV